MGVAGGGAGELGLFEELHGTDDEEAPPKGVDGEGSQAGIDDEGSQAGIDEKISPGAGMGVLPPDVPTGMPHEDLGFTDSAEWLRG